ncbi:hypothetical protein LZK98_11685 [Sphingomonas cannabina]|uniref:hypothetical protein n=1 Tax=Sphingomonas cannabina TaxID=2899123 RepID=UPI001F3A707D|nr:hypothetical protein [Sphingomonas cannabina]UIJ43752.1 hypothetical protein LZK98_11685 [Sphingomonas cannabina]
MTAPNTPDIAEVARKLSERDRDMLAELASACATSLEWHAKGYSTGRTPGYARPLDCGGSNGSDHSYRLSKLVKLGLAEGKQRWGVSCSGSRGSKVYRPSPLGIAVDRFLREGGK